MAGCMLPPNHPNSDLYNNISANIRRQTPICIFTKDSIPDGSALSCGDRDGGNDSDFRMMACKATFDYLK